MKKISAFTLGCKLNFSETDTIVRDFLKNGYKLVPFGEEADIIIINTCTVTAQGERKSKNAVKKANKVSPNGKIVVVGCASQIHVDRFKNLEGVSLILGNKDKTNVFDILFRQNEAQTVYNCSTDNLSTFEHAYSVAMRTRSFLKVQDGCDYPCTYCIIPKVRGKSRNDKIEKIVEDAKAIARQGIKEIILTGVNIGDFGKTTGEKFLDLIKELDKVDGIERYRISSIEPNLLTDEIIEFVAQSKKFMPHFHIPLQSGSDEVLARMKRRYNTKKFVDRVLTAHKFIPDAFFGIDVIVGFPGETDENFEQTYNLLEALPVSYLHIFPYSDRPGTPASYMTNKVNSEKIKVREEKLKQLSDKKHTEFYLKFVGTERMVLFEQKKGGRFEGYSDNYIRVSVISDSNLKNTLRRVKLVSIHDGIARGNMLNT